MKKYCLSAKMNPLAVIAILVSLFLLAGCLRPNDTGEGEGEGEGEVLGPEGGIVDSAAGASVEIPPGALNQDILMAVTDTSDAEIRAAAPDDWLYSGAVTIEAAIIQGMEEGDPANNGFYMTTTVPLNSPLPAGIVLDVYRKGEDYGEWARLDVKATVAADGLTATFEATEPGIYLLREYDEYSTPSFNFDEFNAAAEKELPAPAQPELMKAGGNGPIPIVLIHGAGSYKNEDTYLWGEFIRWANLNLDLENRYQLWVFLHDSDSHPVGFDINAVYGTKKNNALELAEQLQAKRDSGEFPKADETQFIIVAHSRGGLVARAFMENWPTGGDQVLAAVTLATPHHGSCLAVPDWMFDTIEREYWGDFFENMAISVWSDLFRWNKLGSADLAWDNFDGTAPYDYGVPYRTFNMRISQSGITTESLTVSTNDAGWPSDSVIYDETMWLPPEYVLADNVTPGRRGGTTLWNLNHRWSQTDRYLNKFILYGGYLYERGGWLDASAGGAGDKHRGLAYANRVMSNFQSKGQTVSHYAANDGFVALQSALYLGGNEEPIYATKQWFSRTTVSYPINLNETLVSARLKLQNASHATIYPDYDHLEMVIGKDGDSALFQSIGERLDWTAASRPVAVIVEPLSVSGLQVALDPSGSYDNPTAFWPATAIEYRVDWDGNDGLNWSAWATSAGATHTYASAGTYTVSLQVRDQDGMFSAIDTTIMEVGGGGEVPTVSWGTYLGGANEDGSYGIAVDASGNVYVTGRTYSPGWVSNGWDTSHNGDGDSYVVKLNASGAHLWSTFLGGANYDGGYDIAVDSNGNVYAAGQTFSPDWVSNGWDTSYNGGGGFGDEYVVKLNASGAHLWSTYLGGTDSEFNYDIAVDSNGNVYAAGATYSSGWVSNGWDTSFGGGGDGYVVKLNTSGAHLWSTYLGGTDYDYGYDIAVDSNGNVYVTGGTDSSDWVSNGWNTTLDGYNDGYVVKLSPTGAHLWSTYLGGADYEYGRGIAVDSNGNVYATGTTHSSGWVSNGWDTSFGGGADGYVVKLNTSGAHLWSTYLGGTGDDYVADIAVDSNGNVYVAGKTSLSFSGWVSNGWDTSYNGFDDGYAVKLNTSGAHLWSTYLGGTGDDYVADIAVDSNGNVYVAGKTYSPGWVSNGWDTSFGGGGGDGYAVKLNTSGAHLWSTYLGGTGDDYVADIAVDGSGNVYAVGETSSPGWVSNGWDTTYNGGDDGFVLKIIDSAGAL